MLGKINIKKRYFQNSITNNLNIIFIKMYLKIQMLLGTATVTADANVLPDGVSTTGQVGTVTVIEGQGVLIDITGFLLTARTNDVLVWSDIDDNQTPGWVDVNDSQTNGWVDVNDAQSPNWTEIAA